jgi:bifunctional DNA-binding transcriptional regulator/antitoxin component of YhaV-PrlF toxin-antitoxin module
MTDRVKNKRRRGYTRLSAKRQVTLPIRVVQELDLAPGAELRVDAEDGRVVLSRAEPLAGQRSTAIRRVAGSLTGLYGPDYLKKLRSEWR